MSSLGEQFPIEQARVRKVLGHYREIGPVGANTTAVRALCPCGAMVDWDECPYPIDRGATEFTVCCVDPDCGWCVYGATPEGAIAAWHRRTPSAEAHKS